MRNLNFRDYLTMPLPVPPPEVQATIAQVIDSADIAIQQVCEVIERARDTKRSLVQRLFTHGARSEEQRKTRIGWIPKSWTVTDVESVVTEFHGLRPRR